MTSVYSDEFGFGAGALWATRTDIATATPRNFGTLQDVQVAFEGDIKPLYGSFSYAIALARGKTKIELSPKFASIRGGVFNDMFFGTTLTTGETLVTVPRETFTGAATVTVGQGTNWLSDLGVYYSATGIQLTYTRSATPATIGTYSTGTAGTASAGKYFFNTADTVALSGEYTYNSPTTGLSSILTNPRMGVTPTFQAVFDATFDGRQCNFTFLNCVAGKLSLPTKLDDWVINDMTIQASANATGNVGTLNFGI